MKLEGGILHAPALAGSAFMQHDPPAARRGGHGEPSRADRSTMGVSEAKADEGGRCPITLRVRALDRVARYWPGASLGMRNPQPLVTFTFDDVPDSAAVDGAAILEEAGARGTFFVATSLFGAVTPDWRMAGMDDIARLSARGHEIGLHSHRHVPVASMGTAEFAQDLARAAASLGAIAAPESYAYPYGFSSPLHRAAVSRRARASRTTHPGLNRIRMDPHYVRSHAFGQSVATAAVVDRLLDEAAETCAWLVFTGHDVCARPSPFGCTPTLLRHAAEGARARGIALATMKQALDSCGLPAWRR